LFLTPIAEKKDLLHNTFHILSSVTVILNKIELILGFNITRRHVHEESIVLNQISNEIQNKLISLKIDAVTRLNRSFLGLNIQYIANECIQLRTVGLVELI